MSVQKRILSQHDHTRDRGTGTHPLLGNYALPAMLVGTKPSREDGWCRDDSRNLAHDCWLVRSSDPKKRKGDEHIVRFDAVVDPEAMRLNDPSLQNDYLTKKVCALEWMARGSKRGALSGESIRKLSTTYDWYLRWRLGQGIACD